LGPIIFNNNILIIFIITDNWSLVTGILTSTVDILFAHVRIPSQYFLVTIYKD